MTIVDKAQGQSLQTCGLNMENLRHGGCLWLVRASENLPIYPRTQEKQKYRDIQKRINGIKTLSSSEYWTACRIQLIYRAYIGRRKDSYVKIISLNYETFPVQIFSKCFLP